MSIITDDRKAIEVLVVEDNPLDILMIKQGFTDVPVDHHLNIITDGETAINFLYQKSELINARQPDLILLDLNLPKKDGLEVLATIRSNESLRSIPVILLTTSDLDKSLFNAYNSWANCYLIKPLEFDEFVGMVKAIATFWLSVVTLPS